MTKEKLEELISTGATRKCNKCNKILSVTNFHIKADKNNKHYRFNSPCKHCAHIGRNINYHKAYQRKRKYNLSQEDYDLKLKEQKYSCAICNMRKDEYSKDFAVDHCHVTGAIRGLLCSKCNIAIGLFTENVFVMKNAINYIKKYEKYKI